MSSTPHLMQQLPIGRLGLTAPTPPLTEEGRPVEAVVEVVEAVAEEAVEDGQEPLAQEYTSPLVEGTEKCMETPLEYLKETGRRPEPSLENGTGFGALTSNPTLCVSLTLAP